MAQHFFQRLTSGDYQVSLTEGDRKLLHDLPADLMKQLESGDDDGSIYRLFPPGYTDDLGRQVEYDRLMRDDLQASHVEALRTLQDLSGADVLSEEQLYAWIRAINQIRLVLATRLEAVAPKEGGPQNESHARGVDLYHYLDSLQGVAVEALSG